MPFLLARQCVLTYFSPLSFPACCNVLNTTREGSLYTLKENTKAWHDVYITYQQQFSHELWPFEKLKVSTLLLLLKFQFFFVSAILSTAGVSLLWDHSCLDPGFFSFRAAMLCWLADLVGSDYMLVAVTASDPCRSWCALWDAFLSHFCAAFPLELACHGILWLCCVLTIILSIWPPTFLFSDILSWNKMQSRIYYFLLLTASRRVLYIMSLGEKISDTHLHTLKSTLWHVQTLLRTVVRIVTEAVSISCSVYCNFSSIGSIPRERVWYTNINMIV